MYAFENNPKLEGLTKLENFAIQFKGLRKRAGLTQTELAKLLGVTDRIIRHWESPYDSTHPTENNLENLIRVFLNKGVFSEGKELSEAKELWQSAGYGSFNHSWFTKLTDPVQVDWSREFDYNLAGFCGRNTELETLSHWTTNGKIIALLGIGGMGKTSLMVKLRDKVKDQFDYIFARCLLNPISVEKLLDECLQFLAGQRERHKLSRVEDKIALLLEYLQKYRCLLVLDNFDTLLQKGALCGTYLENHQGYGYLLEQLGKIQHQSCLILTSREKPKEVARLEGINPQVRSLKLTGLELEACQELLQNWNLHGTQADWLELIKIYGGNPLALGFAAEHIHVIFNKKIARFLEQGDKIAVDIYNQLDYQFDRLADLEKTIMYWLAIEREPISLKELKANVPFSQITKNLQSALLSLLRRSLVIEANQTDALFTLQPVVMEHTTDRLIKQVSQEICNNELKVLCSHALIKAQAKDYIRELQIELILNPIKQGLYSCLADAQAVETHLQHLLELLRQKTKYDEGYGGGNILNLLCQMGSNLRGYDFSDLNIWQAYLQKVQLPYVNFTGADLSGSVFMDTFGSILSITFSQNGQFFAAGSSDGTIRLWEVSGRYNLNLVWVITAHSDWVRAVAFSPDNKWLASCSDDQTVKLWEIETATIYHSLHGHTNWASCLAFHPNGHLLVSGGKDQVLKIWDLKSGDCLQTIFNPYGSIRTINFSADGLLLAIGGGDHHVTLLETTCWKSVEILEINTNTVWSVAFNPHSRLLASTGGEGIIRLWDLAIAQELEPLRGHSHAIWSIAFSPDGKLLASASGDNLVKLWDLSSYKCIKTLEGHQGLVRSVTFSPNGSIIASCSVDLTILLWEVSTGKRLANLQGYNDQLWSIAQSSDTLLLASGGNDRWIGLWEAENGRSLQKFQGKTSWIASLAFSPDNQLIATSGNGPEIWLWQVSTGSYLKPLHGHTDWVWSVAFSPVANWLISGSQDYTVRLWDLVTEKCVIKYGHTNWIRVVAFSPAGTLFASGSYDNTIRLWSVEDSNYAFVLNGHEGGIISLAFSPDGLSLASGGEDKWIRLWNIETGQCIQTFPGDVGRIGALTFLSNDYLASGGEDGLIKLWDLRTIEGQAQYQSHRGWVTSLVFNPDKELLVSGCEDGTIRFWNIRTGENYRTLKSEKPYEQINLQGVTGITKAQELILQMLA